MDQASLYRLAEQGLARFPPTALNSLADYCWDRSEATGDARYSSLWRTIAWINDLFDDYGGLPTDLVNNLDGILRARLAGVLEAGSPEEGAHLGRLMREDLQASIEEHGVGTIWPKPS